MQLKLFELRDSATFIPIFAFRARSGEESRLPDDKELYLLSRAGYGHMNDSDCVVIGRLDCKYPVNSECTYDPYAHISARTFQVAHEYIEKNWESLVSGQVIDVEYILKESLQPKNSEQLDE